MEVKVTYSISASVPSGKVNISRLRDEIQEAAIIVAQAAHSVTGDVLTLRFKAPLTEDEPSIITSILSSHTGEPLHEVQEMITSQVYPRGWGFRKRTPQMFSDEFKAAKWEFTCSEGKQILFRKNKVMFNTKILNVPAIIFEISKLINGESLIVYQNRYDNFKDLATDSDLFFCYPHSNPDHGSTVRLEFKWPNYSSVDRLPQFMDAGDICRIYFTNNDAHEGIGTAPANAYYVHPTYKCVTYNPYDLATSQPSWPADFPEELKTAQVCVHCVSHNEGELS